MDYQLEYVVWRDTVEEEAGWHTYNDMKKLKPLFAMRLMGSSRK